MKVYTATVADALGEALRCMYWYKDDLRSFLTRAGVPPSLTAQLDWTGNKRSIIRSLLDGLMAKPESGTVVVSKILDAVVEQDDFAHLRRLDDGQRKAEDAEKALGQLKNLLGRETVAERAERARVEKRTEAERRRAAVTERQGALTALAAEFTAIFAMTDERRRGLAFEPFLRSLFALHDLDPRGSFALPGEQTDGSIRVDSQLFLIEARWRQDPASPSDILAFKGKVEGKLDNTLGIFIAMNGFTEEAVKRATNPPAKVILIDGPDLVLAIQGHVDLVEVLRRKIRRAAETGDVFVHFDGRA